MRVVRGHSSGLHKLLWALDRSSSPVVLSKSKATASTQHNGNGLPVEKNFSRAKNLQWYDKWPDSNDRSNLKDRTVAIRAWHRTGYSTLPSKPNGPDACAGLSSFVDKEVFCLFLRYRIPKMEAYALFRVANQRHHRDSWNHSPTHPVWYPITPV